MCRRCRRIRSGLGPGCHQIDQLVGSGDRQWPEQELVELREHRRIGADAERERQHCQRGETRGATEHAQCVANVLDALGDELRAPHPPPPSLVDPDAFPARAFVVAETAAGQLARAGR